MCCFAILGYAQDIPSNYRSKRVAVSDTIVVDSVSINSSKFQIQDKTGKVLDSLLYRVDYKKGIVILSENIQQTNDSLVINYLRYPTFLTRDYFALDPKIIVENTGAIDKLYALQESNT